MNKYQKQYRENNKEKIKEYRDKYRKTHKKYFKIYRKKYKLTYPNRHKEYYIKNKLKIKEYNLLKKFNLTIQNYNNLLKNQNNGCAICGKIEKSKYLNVDHNHNTGKVRGLLCMDCNTGIGKFKDNLNILQNAINYLRSYNEHTIRNL